MQHKRRESDNSTWTMFNEKILPPLIVALCLSVSAGLWATYNKVNEITGTIAQHERDINGLKADMVALKASSVSRDELGGLLKRIELVLDNLLLRAGVKSPPVSLKP